jgi:hypothetical protein
MATASRSESASILRLEGTLCGIARFFHAAKRAMYSKGPIFAGQPHPRDYRPSFDQIC